MLIAGGGCCFVSWNASYCVANPLKVQNGLGLNILSFKGSFTTLCRLHFKLGWICSFRLRGTTAGANNRMDLLSLVTSGVNNDEVGGPDEDILGVVEGWQDDETHNPDVPAISHNRGLTPFVFVPFEEVLFFTFEHTLEP